MFHPVCGLTTLWKCGGQRRSNGPRRLLFPGVEGVDFYFVRSAAGQAIKGLGGGGFAAFHAGYPCILENYTTPEVVRPCKTY